MNPKVMVEYLDLAVFFLVTPEIIGRDRLDLLYRKTRAYVGWIALQVHDDPPGVAHPPPVDFWRALRTMAWSMTAGVVYAGLAYGLWWLYIAFPKASIITGFWLMVFGISLLLMIFSVMGCTLVMVTRNNSFSKVLLLVGGCVFVVARILAIQHAAEAPALGVLH